MRALVSALLGLGLLGGCHASAQFPVYFPDGGTGTPPATQGSFTNGDYSWRQLDPPSLGGAIYAMAALSPSDVWMVGHDLRHFDGSTIKRYPLIGAGAVGGRDQREYADTVVALAPNDVWAAGSRLWHFDGTAWSDQLALLPSAKLVPDRTDWNQIGVFGGEGAPLMVWFGRTGFTFLSGPGKLEVGIYQLVGGAFQLWMQIDPTLFHPWNVFVTPGGEVAMLNSGLFKQDPAAPQTIKQTMGLGNAGIIAGRKGQTVYSVGGPTGNEGLFSATRAETPGDFAPVGEVLRSALPWLPRDPYLVAGPGGQNPSTATLVVLPAIAVRDGGASYFLRGQTSAEHFGVIVDVTGSTVRVTGDRLNGAWPFAALHIGNDLLVSTAGGAIALGSKR